MGGVGVDAGGGDNGGSGAAAGDLDRASAGRDIGAGADDAVDPGFGGAGDDVIAVGVELRGGEVGVGINDWRAGQLPAPSSAMSARPCSATKRSMPSRTSMAAVGVVKLAVPT